MKSETTPTIANDARRHADLRIGFLTHLGFYLIANLIMMAWDATLGEGFFIRIYPLLGWGTGVAFHGLLVLWLAPDSRLRERLAAAMAANGTHRFPRLRRLAIHFVFNTIFCVVCALIITHLMRVGGSFYHNLVFSLCIGTIAWLFIDGSRLLLWGEGKPHKLTFFTILGLTIPSAKYLGDRLAFAILDLPVERVAATRMQNQSGFLVLTILAALFITWFFWNRSTLEHLRAQAEAEKARAAAIEKEALQAQLQLLQAQIEPHMLFNTLANLQGLIAVDAPRAQHMLDQLIQYLRASLSSSRAAQTTLEQEFALMRAYLELMSIRMGARLSYALTLPEPLRQAPIAPMLLQPLVENAIKHGLEPKVAGGRIDVAAASQDGLLTLTVSDTGLGLDQAHAVLPRTGAGIGLDNVRERLQALHGARAALTLASNQPAGTVARITLPLTS